MHHHPKVGQVQPEGVQSYRIRVHESRTLNTALLYDGPSGLYHVVCSDNG